jgi:SAM-dependent methyltransferase
MHCCKTCGTIFTWPVNSPAVLEEFYAVAFEGGVGHLLRESSEAKIKMAEVLFSEVEQWLPHGGSTLDLGAGLGEWLELLHQAARFDTYYGSEYSESMVQDLKMRCSWAEIVLSSGEDMGLVLKDKKFKLITLIAVIEHLYNPQAVLKYVSENLESGGRIIIVYPRVDSLISRLMGRHWHLFSPVAHLTLYSKKGLIAGLARVGLRLVASRRFRHYYDLPYVFSFMMYFFPWTNAMMTQLGKIKWLKRVGFRLYTGIDIIVAESGPSPSQNKSEHKI